MRKVLLAIAVAFLVFGITAAKSGGGVRTVSVRELRDRIEGGWAGQMIGVSFGAPTEFRYRQQIIEGPLPEWKPERVTNAIGQDDLYVDMTFARVLDEKGINATTQDFGAMFRDARYALWHANLAARRALKRGVPASLSGTPKYNAHANDIDFQIESDFIGLMAPGLPVAAADLAWRAGRVMNHGDGIYGGIFVSCMYSAAFFETDPRKVVESGLACLPPASPYAKTISDVLRWSKEQKDWKQTWKLIGDKWDKREPCPDGALKPFNIDAKLNGAYIVLGLLYGDGDFTRTMEIATRAGQDSDCNPSNACGILGTMIGYKSIPDKWKTGIAGIADTKFEYTDFTFRTIAESTEKRAVAMVKQHGGTLEADNLKIRTQTPKPARLELWDNYGSPVERIGSGDSRWKWKGNWRQDKSTRISAEKGAEVSFDFEGTGVILVGPYLSTGGTADVYLDGKLDRTTDVYPDEDSRKNGESVWHAFGLPMKQHSVTLVVRGEPYPASKGSDIGIDEFVVFR